MTAVEISQKLDLILEELRQMKDKLERLQEDSIPETFLLKEAAKLLKLSHSRLYSLIYQKRIIPIQQYKRGKISFTKEEIIRYLNSKSISNRTNNNSEGGNELCQ